MKENKMSLDELTISKLKKENEMFLQGVNFAKEAIKKELQKITEEDELSDGEVLDALFEFIEPGYKF